VGKTLIIIWLIFSIAWSGLMIFTFMLGAGMSPGDSNSGIPFLAYWFAPIVIPAFIYRLLKKRKKH
jgi:lipopolysaccharide export LptBFGC system permease protein LptF